MWKRTLDLEALNRFSAACMVGHLGIEFVAFDESSLSARMPVDARTRQPFGLLHGGASVVLAETLGSTAALLTLPPEWMAVGVEINANHVRSALAGFVLGKASPIHIGRSTQVWEIRIINDESELCCISRLTLAVVPVKRQIKGG
jgi:1,4-dihydroxy-2-naphthoyl-CoA hydrolase